MFGNKASDNNTPNVHDDKKHSPQQGETLGRSASEGFFVAELDASINSADDSQNLPRLGSGNSSSPPHSLISPLTRKPSKAVCTGVTSAGEVVAEVSSEKFARRARKESGGESAEEASEEGRVIVDAVISAYVKQ